MPRTSKVDLPGTPEGFRALCCDALGLIKVVEASGAAASPQVVARWGQPDSHQSIVSMSIWPDMEDFAVARKNLKVDVLNSSNGALQSQLLVPTSLSDEPASSSLEGAQQPCGLHLFRQSGSRRTVLSATANCILAIQSAVNSREDGNPASLVSAADTSNGASSWRLSDNGSIACLKVDSSETRAVYGGKGLDVHLWDLYTGSKLWNAKQPKKDSLGISCLPHITTVTYLSGGDPRKVVTGTGYHEVRLYDVDAQRRPVHIVDHGESPITSMVEESDGYTVHVGTGSGDLTSIDMRMGRSLGSFKGACAGSIRAVVRHPTMQLLASCGLDRYLRIHDVRTRQLLAKVFLKQQLVALGFKLQTNVEDINKPNYEAQGEAETHFEEQNEPVLKRKKGLPHARQLRRK